MKLGKKLKAFLALLTLISFVSTTFAQDRLDQEETGRYLNIEEGGTVPFAAWCFDETATAILLAKKQLHDEVCQLRLDSELALLNSKHQYELGSLNLRLETLNKEYEQMILLKDEELQKLENAALKRPNSYWYLWFGGGVVATVLVYYIGSGIGDAIALSTLN